MNTAHPLYPIVLEALRGDVDQIDTDCNAATAGSIMGCALGTAGIPAHWTNPFNDMIRTDLKGMASLKISDMARRMFEVAHNNARRD